MLMSHVGHIELEALYHISKKFLHIAILIYKENLLPSKQNGALCFYGDIESLTPLRILTENKVNILCYSHIWKTEEETKIEVTILYNNHIIFKSLTLHQLALEYLPLAFQRCTQAIFLCTWEYFDQSYYSSDITL